MKNHWLLFASIIEAALLEFTGECDFKRLTKGVYKFRDNWYLGDGIYSDGPKYKVNYYNSLVIHPMLIDTLLVMHKYDFLNIELKRSSRYVAELERIISPGYLSLSWRISSFSYWHIPFIISISLTSYIT